MAAPPIHTTNNWHSQSRYEAFPPWLLSAMVHMLVIIALGFFHIGLTPGTKLQLVLSPEESLSERETEIDGFVDLDVAIGADITALATVDDTPAPIATNELLTSLEIDWEDLVSTENGTPSLVAGFGNGALTAGGGGGKGTTSFFGLAGEGGKFVYVFDRSASMLSTFTLYSEEQILSNITPLRCAKMEMARSLGELTGAHQFQIVFYNHAPWVYSDDPDDYNREQSDHQLIAATEEHKARANDFIEAMEGAGFTNHLLALEAAVALQPDVIFLLTDGEAKDDLHTSVVRRIFKYCQQHHIVINIVHFSNTPRPDCTLIPLAEKTGGQHLFISLESLAEVIAQPVAMR